MFAAHGWAGGIFQIAPSCLLLAIFQPRGADAFAFLDYHLAPSAAAGQVILWMWLIWVLPWTQKPQVEVADGEPGQPQEMRLTQCWLLGNQELESWRHTGHRGA